MLTYFVNTFFYLFMLHNLYSQNYFFNTFFFFFRYKECGSIMMSSTGQQSSENENKDSIKAVPLDEITKKLKAENEMLIFYLVFFN